MSFNTNTGKQSFAATASQTAFTFNFKIYANTDIKIYLTTAGTTPNDTEDLLTLTTDYTISIDGDDGGTVTLVVGATVNDTIVINRTLPLTRDTSYVTQGDLLATTLNIDQDYQTYLLIDANVKIEGGIRLPVSAVSVSTELPAVVIGGYLKWNATGTAIENDVRVADTWDAEADAKTALSYATEAEDVPVNVFTSDGDGTFTSTAQAGVFSSLHYSIKAAVFNPVDFVDVTTAQTVAGIKTFSSSPIVPTATAGDSSTKAASTAFAGTAITNALASPTLTGSATTNVTTNNIAMTGIGTIGTLAVGDIIQMSGFANASNNSEFTVEVITDDDNVIVNQAHAGGTTSKSLITETATATIILLSKWYSTTIKVGQGDIDMSSLRTAGVTYTNGTGRPISISFFWGLMSNNSTASITIGTNTITNEANSSGQSGLGASFDKIVGIGETYSYNRSTAGVSDYKFIEAR